MKFSLALISLLAGFAIANPAAVAPDNIEARACKLRDNHCSNDGECCSLKKESAVKRHPLELYTIPLLKICAPVALASAALEPLLEEPSAGLVFDGTGSEI
ncbi:hypothetical protein ACJZ2D_000295 [Fusarium nematophilum]